MEEGFRFFLFFGFLFCLKHHKVLIQLYIDIFFVEPRFSALLLVGSTPGSSGFNFPSDHIILPLEWYNSWKTKTEIISQPYLVLHKIGSNKTIRFYLAGEYPNISKKSLEEPYILERTFKVPPSSLSKHILVFKIESWWDETSENF
jgi:hypothetical protein